LNGVNGIVAGKSLTFRTTSISARPVISLAEDSIMSNMNGRTDLKPKLYIDFGKPIANNTLAMSNIKLNGNDLPEDSTLDFDADMQNAVLTFSSDLEEALDCTLSIKEYTDEDNGKINSTEFAFRTMPPENLPGSGTIDDPFRVYHQNHLKQLNNTTPINYLQGGFFFKQIDDITLVGEWSPIGKDIGPFTGNYNGNGKTISNIIVTNGSYEYPAALFNKINSSSFSNLTLKDADIFGQDYSSVFCGYLENSLVENVKVEGNISIETPNGNNPIGVIAGNSTNNTIRNVSVTGNINLSKNEEYLGGYHGGIIGWSNGSDISYCYVDSPEGVIKGEWNVGGLIGYSDNQTKVNNCYARINLEARSQGVGGLIGQSGSTVNNCYSDCQITSTNTGNAYAGGLIGRAYTGPISNCYASGSIFLNADYSKYVGVLLGESNEAVLNNSFSTVKITVRDSYSYDGNLDCYNPDDTRTPLWDEFDPNSFTYEYVYDSSGTNYYGTGYKTTLNWNTAYWFNLTEGGFPKLIGLPNR
ncbi:MAG: hypothetical protein J6Z11_05100, partial [Candidatus Riflebacteria bacterium]|nr:hypothetical protein [Candidatus Riflebacteria bacterium]